MVVVVNRAKRGEAPTTPAYSLQFDGVSQRGELPYNSAFAIRTNLTLVADIKPSATGGNRTIFARFTPNNAADDAYVLRLEGGKLLLYGNNGSWTAAVGATTIPTGVWTRVEGTFDGSHLRVFVDGLQDGVAAKQGPLQAGNAKLFLGGHVGGDFFAGKIANAGVYDTGVAAALYNTQQPGSGSILYDRSGRGFDMALVGEPTWSPDTP